MELVIIDSEYGLMLLNKMCRERTTTAIPVIIASTSTQLLQNNAGYFQAKHGSMLLQPFDLEDMLMLVEQNIA